MKLTLFLIAKHLFVNLLRELAKQINFLNGKSNKKMHMSLLKNQ